MIFNIANPYNVLALYNERADLSNQQAISCPATLLPFQLKVGGSDTFFQVLLVDPNTLETIQTVFTVLDVVAGTRIKANTFSDSTKYLTYYPDGSELTAERGYYRLKIIHGDGSNNTIRYSHLLAIRDLFEAPDSIIATSDGTTVTITPSSKGAYSILYLDTGTGFDLIGQDIGQFPEANISGGGTIKVNSIIGQKVVTNLYTITSGLTVTKTTENKTDERLMYLEFWNSTDIPAKDLIYQSGYKQRFYFYAWYNNPEHIIEENFIKLGNNKTVFSSASEYHRLSFDIYPFPTYLNLVLGQIKYHDNYKVVDVLSGQEYEIDNVQCAINPIEEIGKVKGTISFDTNHVFTTGCETNKV